MRNVLTIFKNDLKALYKHFLAFVIIIALLVLPALYAWFNIYAFWDPYSNTDGIKIAVVSDDADYMDDDGKIINIGNELIDRLKDNDRFGFVFMDNADEAVDAVYAGEYYAAVVIDEDFTYNMYNFLKTDMFSPTIKFYQNEKKNAVAVKIVEAAADTVKQIVNEKYIAAVVETMFDKLNALAADVKGDSSVNTITATLLKIKDNLDSYDDTVSQFIAANGSLVNTLKNTNSTLDYSVYLIGNERINLTKQIGYMEDSQVDLSKINEEVNILLIGLEDSIQEAIYRLDRLYKGADETAAEAALADLEAQYQELIDYLTHSGITGTEAEDTLSALNHVSDKITTLRVSLGMQEPVDVKEAAQTIEEDYKTVTIPDVYSMLTDLDYKDIFSDQSMESIMSFMADDANSRLSNVQSNLNIAQTTNSNTSQTAALQAAFSDSSIAEQELSALGSALDALETASGVDDKKASDTANDAAEEAGSFADTLKDILNGNRDLDLVRDLQLMSDAISATRIALTESVYPAINTILENVQDSLGDISSVLLDLGKIIGKAQPVVDQLGNTFGTVNSALVQVNDLVKHYADRIGEVIGVINGDTDNEAIARVLTFFEVDPIQIGQFFAKPVTMTAKSIYTVKSYGTAMAPFYTMLAIWVGCIILNSVMKFDTPVELPGATERQKFFGRYLIVFLMSELQTMVIMLGDLYLLGVGCMYPGLFLLTGFFTSLVCSMLAYSFAVAFGNIGKALFVVIMIIQIAGSGGSYPIELLPDFFQQVYLFFPFPYAINAMREAIAGMYQNAYTMYLVKLMIFFVVGLFIGLVVKRTLGGVNEYMNEQLEKTEMM